MNADAWIWAVLVACSLMGGVAVAAVLVVPRSVEPLIAIGFVGAVVGTIYAAAVAGGSAPTDEATLYAAAFALAAAGGGYALASSLLLEAARFAGTARHTEPAPDADAGLAVVLVVCSEPPRYSMIDTASLLADLEAEGRLDASLAALPLLFFAQKARYSAVGGSSPATGQLRSIAEQVEKSISRMRPVRVYAAGCTGLDSVSARVAEAVSAGHSTIVIADLSVASSTRAVAALNEVDAVRLGDAGVDVVLADNLGTDDALPTALAARVRAAVTDCGKTGIVLVGHGQTEEEARRDGGGFSYAETVFLSRVRMLLVEGGVPADAVRIAWAEWIQPDVTSTVRHFAALGCERIVVAPAVHAVDTLATRLDLEIAVRQARVSETVSIVVLPTWRDDPALIDAVTRSVEATLSDREN